MSNKKERVRRILEEFPQTRDDDKLLMVVYWALYDGVKIPYSQIKRATPPETIRRARQMIQSSGELLPSKSTIIARRRKEDMMLEAVRKGQVI